ncbi:hypothetical protein ACFWIB_30910 [Streptomyces sp. NPDC127051]|uniref:hypothetical protein n=1 Tax=Streptomyces sp. NPDC127051 TaxID=3347119 RepID=UPI003663BEBE
MREAPQPHALLPGVSVRACQVHTHVAAAPGEPVLQVHVTRYGFETRPNLWEDGPTGRLQTLFDGLELHTMAVEPLDPMKQTGTPGSAEVVLGAPGDLPPLLMLDRLCRRRTAARVIAVVTSRRAAVVWVRAGGGFPNPASGYTMTVTCDEPAGPVELYASALYGWMSWWYETVLELRGGEVPGELSPMRELPPPPPPDEVDILEAWRSYRVRITDIHWETRHPLPEPPRPHSIDPDPE